MAKVKRGFPLTPVISLLVVALVVGLVYFLKSDKKVVDYNTSAPLLNMGSKTYSNKELGFSFEYPGDWEEHTSDDNLNISLVNRGRGSDRIAININRQTPSALPDGYTSAEIWFKDFSLNNPKTTRQPNDGYYYGPGSDTPEWWYMSYQGKPHENVFVGNIKAVQVVLNEKDIIFPYNKDIYILRIQGAGKEANQKIINEILSSFKFQN